VTKERVTWHRQNSPAQNRRKDAWANPACLGRGSSSNQREPNDPTGMDTGMVEGRNTSSVNEAGPSAPQSVLFVPPGFKEAMKQGSDERRKGKPAAERKVRGEQHSQEWLYWMRSWTWCRAGLLRLGAGGREFESHLAKMWASSSVDRAPNVPDRRFPSSNFDFLRKEEGTDG